MPSPRKRNSLLCPNCRRLVSRSAPECPGCGLKRPGSAVMDNPLTRLAGSGSVLKLIIGVNIAMFILSVLIDMRPGGSSPSPLGVLAPSSNALMVLGSTGSVPLFALDRWWTLVSANYLHGGLLHLAFNMIALYQLGPLIEREYGPSRLVIIYTLSGIGGYLVSALFGVRFTIGASAAVCGLIGAALYFGRSRGGVYGKAVYSQIGSWALFIFIFGFIVPGINNWGHGGGLLCGALIAFLLGYEERRPSGFSHTALSAACLAGTGLVLAWSVLNGIALRLG